MRRIVFVGNCQAYALMDAFNQHISPYTGERAFHVAAYHDIDAASRAALDGADVIVDLIFDFAQRVNLADLGLDKPVIPVPYVNGNFLWPFAYEAHPRNARTEFLESGPYPIQLGDAYLNRLMRDGVPAEEAASRYLDLDINQKVRLDRRFEMNLALQRQRDEKTGFAVAELMERYFREEPVFLTPDHPNVRIFLHVAQNCFARLGVPAHLIARLPHIIRRSPFPQDRLPVHPRLAAHFGLAWANEATRYQFWLDGDFTFAEFIARYLRYEWCEDFAIGHYLAAQPGQRGEAVARLRAGLAAHPAADRAWALLSHVLIAEGALPEALEAARQAVSRNPGEAEAFAHLGNLLTGVGEIAAAKSAYERAVALEPEHTPWLRLLAGHWERQGKRAEAGALAATLAHKDPLDYELHVQRGHLLAGRGDAAGAVSAFSHALGLAPHIPGGRAARSHVLAALGRLPEAIADTRAALDEAPEDRDLRLHLGNLLAASGDAAGAEAVFLEATRANPNDAEGYRRLAGVLAAQGREQAAARLRAEDTNLTDHPSKIGTDSEETSNIYTTKNNPPTPVKSGILILSYPNKTPSKRITFLGNYQISTLYHVYREFVLPYCDDKIKYIEVYKKINNEDKGFLLKSDIVVSQLLDNRQETNLEDFNINAKIHLVPYVTGVGIYWPFGGFAHRFAESYKYYPRHTPYNAETGDFYLNKLINEGVSYDEITRRYINEDLNKLVNLDRRLEISLTTIKKRDEKCRYDISEFIRDNFDKEILFSSPGHFRRSISLVIINELFGRLEVEPRLIERINRLYAGNPHAGSDLLPIHPQVANHFCLKFISENQRYRYWHEGRFTFAEYIARYVRFEFNEPLVEAIIFAGDDNHIAAIPKFEKALRISPHSGYAHKLYSHTLWAVGQRHEALALAKEAAAILEDDSEELPVTLLHLGHCFADTGDLEEAVRVVRRALSIAPNRPSLYRVLSSFLDQQGKHEEANAVIDSLSQLDPLDYEALAHLGHMRAGRGDLEGAAGAFSQSLTINPRQASTMGAISHVLGGLRRWEEAVAMARGSLQLQPGDIGMQTQLGDLLLASGDNGGAVKAFRATLAVDPENAELRHRLDFALAQEKAGQDAASLPGAEKRREGEALFHAGKFVEAEAAFRAALALDDSDPERHWWLSATLAQQECKAEAAIAVEEAIRRAPGNARYWEHLGHMRAAVGEFKAAEQAFRRVCEIDPGRGVAFGALSHVLRGLGRGEEAAEAARKAAILRPDDADLHVHLGDLLEAIAEHAEASAAYQRAIALGLERADIFYRLAESLSAEGKYEEALPSVRKALVLSPNDKECLQLLANLKSFGLSLHLNPVRHRLINTLWHGQDPFRGFPVDLYQIDTQGWNSDHPYLWEAIEDIKPACIVEIGVWKGASTITMAKKLKEIRQDGAVIAVDTWLGSSEHWLEKKLFNHLCLNNGYPSLFHKFAGNIFESDVQDFVIPLPMDSLNAARLLNLRKIQPDLIHIDGGHDYRSVISDLEAWWPLLRPGGILIGDDYTMEGGWVEVRQAFDEFFGRIAISFINMSGKCMIRKPVNF